MMFVSVVKGSELVSTIVSVSALVTKLVDKTVKMLVVVGTSFILDVLGTGTMATVSVLRT